jgi:xanthine dehydrogenase YagS FAD-binding subunit
MRDFEHVDAPDTARAIALLDADGVDRVTRPRVIAGGTDLLDEMKEGLIAPVRLVNIKVNAALRGHEFDTTRGLRAGALATLAELQGDPAVRSAYPLLAAALDGIASPQIRNMATIGGNLCQRPRCWYYRDHALLCSRKGGPMCYAYDGENAYHAIFGGQGCVMVHPSDLAPALIALDATISCTGVDGRRTLPLAEFFVGPDVDITRENVLAAGEVLESVTVPPPPDGAHGAYLKVRGRGAWDFATLSVAAQLEMKGDTCRRARLVLGGVAPIPWPVPAAEALLTGRRITTDLARQAGEAALRDTETLAHNGYKVPMGRNLVRRAVLAAAGLG